MEFEYSNRILNIKNSAVGEILKMTSDPNIIAFSAGNPAEQTFPLAKVQQWTQKILSETPILAMQYSVSEGYPPLCSRLKEFLAQRYQIGSADDSMMITSGAEQAIDLVTKILCNEGDAVLCESPSFVGALNTFRSYNTKLVGVEMEEDGINIEKMEEALEAHPNIRLMYLIPNFQNPTGITMSLEKRKAVLELSKKYSVPILEDNPYGDLRFSGDEIPSIKSMDRTGNVIYCGSFSKVLAPGLRVGYLCAPSALFPKLMVAKQCSDVHTAMLAQLICFEFLTDFDFDAHIAHCQEIYRQKYQTMAQAIEEHFHPKIAVTKPQGGLFLWCTLPKGSDMMGFCREAVARGVAVIPGSAFMMDESEETTSFRMNYSTVSDEKIREGIRILGQLSREYLR